MNRDADIRMLPEGDYPYAMNCLIGSSENENLGSVENVLGNVQTNYIPRDRDIVIGFCDNKAQETIFFFIHNPIEPHRIIEHNINTRNVRIILDSDLLNFSLDFPINHANVMEDEIYWTDGLNPPRGIDFERAYSFTVGGVPPGIKEPYVIITEEVLTNAARPPLFPCAPQFVDNLSNNVNLLKDDTYKFRYAYVYKNDQTSALSPESYVPLRNTNQTPFNDITQQNEISIDIPAGTSGLVREIVLYVQINDGKWAECNRRTRDSVAGSSFSYRFTGNEVFTFIDDKYAAKKYDNLPRVANCQEFIGETYLLYANLIEGYELVENIDFSVSVEKLAIDQWVSITVKDYVQKTFKHGGKYSVGIVYKDEQGRESTVYSNTGTEFTVPEYIEEQNNDHIADLLYRYIMNAEIRHEPPSWAKAYHVVITAEQEYLNFRQFIDYGNIIQYDKLDENKPYLDFSAAIDYDIQVGDEIQVIHSYEPSTKNEPALSIHEINFYDNPQGENIIRIIDIQGDKYYYESPYTMELDREKFYLFEVRTPRKDEDEIFYQEIATYPIFLDPTSGKYIHVGETNQEWDAAGNLTQAAILRPDLIGDTYIHIQQADAIVSSRGRYHWVLANDPNNPGPGPPPSEYNLRIDGLFDVWHPLNDLTTYLIDNPLLNGYMTWYGVTNTAANTFINNTQPTIQWEPSYDLERQEENWFDRWSGGGSIAALIFEDPLNAYFE
ncbi:MAG: hypothetical protein ACTSR6_11855, partial [Candidatus Heimdallarchaeota archaeon]